MMQKYSQVLKQLSPVDQQRLFSLPQDKQIAVLEKMHEAQVKDRAFQQLNYFIETNQVGLENGVRPENVAV